MAIVPVGRDNGLPPAASYVALVDVDPPLADEVLALLHQAGIPAIAEPLAGETGPYQDVRPPERPTDRVHVDRERQGPARDTIGAALPALRADFKADVARRSDAAVMRAAEVDRAFSQIVSGFGPSEATTTAWPTDEPKPPPAPGGGSGLSSRLVRRAAPEPDEEPDPTYWPEDHFVPPPPPPLPPLGRVNRFAWAGLLGGPALLVLSVVLDLPQERLLALAALFAFIAGFATLVVRMPDKAADDDTWDDGAVV